MLIQQLENLLQNFCVCYLDCEEQEDFNLLKDRGDQLLDRHMDNKLAEEIEVHLCGDFLIDPLIDVVVLIGGLAFAFFEVLVELAAIFKEQMEDLADRVVDDANVCVPLGHLLLFEGFGPDEHALQDVDHFDL